MKAELNRLEIDQLWQRLKLGEAEAIARDLQSAPEGQLPARTLRGIALYEAGQPGAAVEELSAIVRQQPVHPVAALHRGLANFRAGNAAEAHRDLSSGPMFPSPGFLKRFLRLFWPLRFQYPSILTAGLAPVATPLPHDQEFYSARDGNNQADRKKLAEQLWKEGVGRFLQRDQLTALELLRRAAELDRDRPEIHLNLAWCQLHLGRGNEAEAVLAPLFGQMLDEYEQTRKKEKLPPPVLVTEYCWALHETRNFREATALLSTIRPEGPDDYMMHAIAALSWMMLDENDKAEPAFDTALGPFFLDTWEEFLKPFWLKILDWLKTEEGARAAVLLSASKRE